MSISTHARAISFFMATAIAVLCIPPAVAVADDGMTMTCRQLYRAWKKMAAHKAFAATQKVNGLQGCGWAAPYGTQQQANMSALKNCRSDVAQFFPKQKQECRLIK